MANKEVILEQISKYERDLRNLQNVVRENDIFIMRQRQNVLRNKIAILRNQLNEE